MIRASSEIRLKTKIITASEFQNFNDKRFKSNLSTNAQIAAMFSFGRWSSYLSSIIQLSPTSTGDPDNLRRKAISWILSSTRRPRINGLKFQQSPKKQLNDLLQLKTLPPHQSSLMANLPVDILQTILSRAASSCETDSGKVIVSKTCFQIWNACWEFAPLQLSTLTASLSRAVNEYTVTKQRVMVKK